jgi:hypothetical protein
MVTADLCACDMFCQFASYVYMYSEYSDVMDEYQWMCIVVFTLMPVMDS